MPSPQILMPATMVCSIWQVELQPSPERVLPSSQDSPGAKILSPQKGKTVKAKLEDWNPGGTKENVEDCAPCTSKENAELWKVGTLKEKSDP